MAKKPFTWHDLERISVACARDPVETEAELLAWLRAYHVLALGFRNVYRGATRSHNIQSRGPVGRTIYRTLKAIVEIYFSIVAEFPQHEVEELLRMIEEIATTPAR